MQRKARARVRLMVVAPLAFGLHLTLQADPTKLPAEDLASGAELSTPVESASAVSALAAAVFFEPNVGQMHEAVRFLWRGPAYNLFIGGDGMTLAIEAESREGAPAQEAAVRVRFASEAQPAQRSSIEGVGERRGRVNYLIGKDPSRWHTDIPTYSAVHQRNVYPGIDLVYHGGSGKLEYDFIVAPGVDPNQIRLHVDGVESVETDEGDLVIATAAGAVRWGRPAVYQETADGREWIECAYTVEDSGVVTFSLGSYDPLRTLIIDPVLIFAGRLGISDEAIPYPYPGFSVGLGSDESVFVTGSARAPHFPTKNGFQGSVGRSGQYAFVAKLTPDGRELIFSTYLGGMVQNGSPANIGLSVKADSKSAAWVVGYTLASDFPVKNPLMRCEANKTSSFVTKLSPAGSALDFSTCWEQPHVLTLDRFDNVFLAGWTADNRAVTTPFTTVIGSGPSGPAVWKLSPNGAPVWSTWIRSSPFGPPADDVGIDRQGNVYLAGVAVDVHRIPLVNALQAAHRASDAFVIKLDNTGSRILYSTYFGGSQGEYPVRMAADEDGYVYLAGYTNSSPFPEKDPLDLGLPSTGNRVFVSKLAPDGGSVVFSSIIGATTAVSPKLGMGVDSQRNVHVAGWSPSLDWPQVGSMGDSGPMFVSKLSSSGKRLLYSTFFGSPVRQMYPLDLAISSGGDVYVTGLSGAGDTNPFPATPDFPESLCVWCAFVVKLSPERTLRGAPTALSFEYGLGEEPPASRSFTVWSEVGSPVRAAASNEGGLRWLGASADGETVHASADPAGLGVGRYRGTLSLSADGTDNSPVTVPVQLAVWGPGPRVAAEGIVNAASLVQGPLALDSWASVFGARIAPDLIIASRTPLPTNLGGVRVTVIDSAGVETDAGLQFVAPGQLNFLTPGRAASGPARLRISDEAGDSIEVPIEIASVAPGFFTANSNGRGPAAARFLLVRADGSRLEWFTFWPDPPAGERPNVPIDMGGEQDEVYISFFGTGFRSQRSVSCTIGGEVVPVLGAVAQGEFEGLDQLVAGPLPRFLVGRGEVNTQCEFDGLPANMVTLAIE